MQLPPELEALYRNCPPLPSAYVAEVLGLSGKTAEKVTRIHGGIHADEAGLLGRLTAEVAPESTLEIGLGHGFSAMAICLAAGQQVPAHRHTVIDPHQFSYWRGRGMAHLATAGLADRVTLHEDVSCQVLPRLETEGFRCELAFIDGWHTFDFVFVDFFFVDRLLRPGGLVIFDDANWPSIRPVLRYAVTNLGYLVHATLPEKTEQTEIDRQLGLEGSCIALKKPVRSPHREVFFHVPF